MKTNFLLLSILICVKSSSLYLKEIRREILAHHNYCRAMHQVGKLERDKELEKIAQKYSEKLAADNKGLVHSKNGYGENLHYCWSSSGICVTGKHASENWYNEINQYSFDNPGFTSGVGHFTQLVWKGSQKIGCGAACNSENKCFVTCNYSPPGNYEGQFATNVLPKTTIEESYEYFYEEEGDNFEDEEDEGNSGMYLNKNKILSIISLLILLI